jgi:hypothetical protein
MIRYFSLLLIMGVTYSCNDHEGARSMNQPSRPLSEIRSLVVNTGDTSAYYKLFNAYLDNSTQDEDFFYYAYVMAFKHHYPKAYMDGFVILSNLYGVDITKDSISLKGMDSTTRQLAIDFLKGAATHHYDAAGIYQRISPE